MRPARHIGSVLAWWTHWLPARFEHFRDSAAAWAEPAHRNRPVAENPSPDRPRVLVVDDSVVHQTMMVASLARWGIAPLVAADGAEAVALACGHEFDLILMDLQMPVLGGLAATMQIRSFELDHARPRVPVVACSSSPDADDAATLRAFGLDAALAKPCSMSSLEACLSRWCAFDFRELARQSINA